MARGNRSREAVNRNSNSSFTNKFVNSFLPQTLIKSLLHTRHEDTKIPRPSATLEEFVVSGVTTWSVGQFTVQVFNGYKKLSRDDLPEGNREGSPEEGCLRWFLKTEFAKGITECILRERIV